MLQLSNSQRTLTFVFCIMTLKLLKVFKNRQCNKERWLNLVTDSYFQSLPDIGVTELLIKNPIVDIWQNFGYGLRVKRKEKFGSRIILKIILRNKIPGNNCLFIVTSTYNKVCLPK